MHSGNLGRVGGKDFADFATQILARDHHQHYVRRSPVGQHSTRLNDQMVVVMGRPLRTSLAALLSWNSEQEPKRLPLSIIVGNISWAEGEEQRTKRDIAARRA